MSTTLSPSRPSSTAVNSRQMYHDLFDAVPSQQALRQASDYLQEQLSRAESIDEDLPSDREGLLEWMQQGVVDVGREYQQYLDARKQGEGRRYFANKSQALYFLQHVAPTKMVDGAWLYGLLNHWQDARFVSLIQTYLEELGEGLPGKNHVVLYKKLLATHGLEHWHDLDDDYFTQGAIQLALACRADKFLPEIIGYNLGYEQLPLHLLITAYELKELGIDPYYFTLHVTVDNADSGHARKAVDAVFDAMPQLGSSEEFFSRVCQGYRLNFLGQGTTSVIDSFDLERELVEIFRRKSTVGQYAHSDYRNVAGRTVNDWLAEPSQTSEFITALENSGWFRRHQDPANSRFWKLIEGEKARMFGVFSNYEQQVIYDWISGDSSAPPQRQQTPLSRCPFAVKMQQEAHTPTKTAPRATAMSVSDDSDFDSEASALENRLAATPNREDAMALLIRLMSPANHHTASGLAATQIFCSAFT